MSNPVDSIIMPADAAPQTMSNPDKIVGISVCIVSYKEHKETVRSFTTLLEFRNYLIVMGDDIHHNHLFFSVPIFEYEVRKEVTNG